MLSVLIKVVNSLILTFSALQLYLILFRVNNMIKVATFLCFITLFLVIECFSCNNGIKIDTDIMQGENV